MYALSLSCLFKLLDTAKFCENTRGKLPENGQSEMGKKMGSFKAKIKVFSSSVIQNSGTRI